MYTKTDLLVQDVMLELELVPKIDERGLFKEALEIMDMKGLGMICIVSDDYSLSGIVTDGDIRRMLNSVQKPFAALMTDDAITHAVSRPLTTGPQTKLKEAVELMGRHKIWDLPIVRDETLVGLLHLHPAIKRVLEFE